MRISDWSEDVCSPDLPTLELRTIIVTERAIGCEFHLCRAEMQFMLSGRGWRITDVVHRSKYKGVEQHARKEDADEGSNNTNHFSVSPLGSLRNRRGFRRFAMQDRFCNLGRPRKRPLNLNSKRVV